MTNALKLPGGTMPLRISPVVDLGGKLTVEAWIRPSTTDAARAVLSIGDRGRHLVLGAGNRELSFLLVENDQVAVVLATTGGAVPADRWTHVALTLTTNNAQAVAVTLCVDGKPAASKTLATYVGRSLIPTGNHATVWGLLQGRLLETCFLGGPVRGVPGFAGLLAEARVWSTAVPVAELAARRTTRARGDEDQLAACYRLERVSAGCLHDISARRGFGVIGRSGATIAPAPGLALPSTSDRDQVRLEAHGKLTREWVQELVKDPGIVFVTTPTSGGMGTGAMGGGSMPGTGGNDDPRATPLKRHRREARVFDATFVARAPDGKALTDRNLEVRFDRGVELLVNQGAETVTRAWAANTTYTVPVPPSGRVRVRFTARDLSCAVVRARVDGMADGLWTVVRPDAATHGKLRSITQGSLLKPSDGRPSPMPSGASADDAAALAGAFQILGRSFPGAAARRPAIHAQARYSWGDFTDDVSDTASDAGDLAEDGVEYAEDGIDYLESSAEDGVDFADDLLDSGLDLVDEGVGQLADGVEMVGNQAVAVGEAAVKTATRAARTANQLCAKAGAETDALIKQAQKAPAQLGQSAIRSFIDAADKLAVVARAGIGEVSRITEIVGTAIVDGVTVAWKVVVAGVNDAVAACTALVKRIGGAIEQFIDFLAYLFDWKAFLEASDRMLAIYEQQLAGLSGYVASLASWKPKLAEYLNLPIDASIGKQSAATLCGLDINDDSPGVDEVSYVLDLIDQVLSAADLAVSTAVTAATGAAGTSATNSRIEALGGAADQTNAQFSLTRYESPHKLLTTPLGELVKNASGVSTASSSLVDFVFDEAQGMVKDVLDDSTRFLRQRLVVPYLTDFIEESVLWGRELTLLRLISLLAGIGSVLTDKIGDAASSGSLDTRAAGVARTATTRGNPSATSQGRDVPKMPDGLAWAIWGAGLGAAACGIVGTFYELQALKQPAGTGAKALQKIAMQANRFTYIGAALAMVRSGMQAGLSSVYVPANMRRFSIAFASTEAFAAMALMATCLLRKEGIVAKYSERTMTAIDRVEAALQIAAALTIIALSIWTAVEAGLKTKPQKAMFAMRAGASFTNAFTRAWASCDNLGGSKQLKYVSCGLLAFCCVVETAEAAVSHHYDYQEI